MGELAPKTPVPRLTRRSLLGRFVGLAVAVGILHNRRGEMPVVAAATEAPSSLGPASLAELLDESFSNDARKVIKTAGQPAVLDQVSEDGRKFGILADLTGFFPNSNGRLGIRVEGGKTGSMGVMLGHPNADRVGGDVFGIEFSGGKVTLNHWQGGVGPKFLQGQKLTITGISEGSPTDVGLDLSEDGHRIAGVLSTGEIARDSKQLENPLVSPGQPAQLSYWKTPDSDATLVTVAVTSTSTA